MNLFFLDIDPKKCAEYHCDKHVVKMILELIQMMYTAHNFLKTKDIPINGYRSFNPQHPTCIWVRRCVENYTYTSLVAKYLCEEYTYRYGRIHKSQKHLDWLIKTIPEADNISSYKPGTVLSYNKRFQELGHTPVPLAMFDDTKFQDTFKSYHFYYIVHKRQFAKWTCRSSPWWYTSGNYKLIYLIK